MEERRQIEFVLRGRLDGVEITPDTIGLSRFNEFNRQVEEFIGGSDRLPLDQVRVHVEPGSYKLVTRLPAIVLSSVESDLRALEREDSLGELDPRRAQVIERWQARAKSKPELSYTIRPPDEPMHPVEVSARSDFRVGEVIPWVKVEKYLFGTVVDMGGATKANVHIRLDDSGKLVRIGSDQEYLHDQEENHLYRKVLVRVEARQHYRTGELKDLRLLSFEDHHPAYDEDALDRFAAAGKASWADVPDASGWVEQLRGGGG
jgi:hypothetical protein